jgi:hypothetical protein
VMRLATCDRLWLPFLVAGVAGCALYSVNGGAVWALAVTTAVTTVALAAIVVGPVFHRPAFRPPSLLRPLEPNGLVAAGQVAA